MKANFKSIIMLAVVVAVIVAAVSFFTQNKNNEDEFSYSDLIELFEVDLVKSYEVDGDLVMSLVAFVPDLEENGDYKFDSDGNAVYQMKDGKPVTKKYEYKLGYNFQLTQINDMIPECQRLEKYDYLQAGEAPWYQVYLPYIIMAVILGAFWIFMLRSSVGGGKMNTFSKSRAKVAIDDKNAVKFADVAGADEEKAELEEVVEFLKDPAKFVKLGARIPRGVLLVGPPGTGKTLLAKAVAGEAGVPFFSISGSDFVEMYVGVGASRVRDLFDNARKTPASIIFIDEIDAVGRHRGAGLGGGHDEREQTLNQLLVEMDGFGTNSGVIVMAATNRPDILDPALLRPGRFDRRVTVNYPDIKGREEILRVHCRNKPLEETVNLKKIAQMTIGFTGAELANLMNEAALRAAKENKALIGMTDIEESFMKLLLGPQKKNRVRTEADNKLCAYHEAGHAVASYFCKHTDPVKHITIIPAGSAGGVTVSVPTEDKMTTSKNAMIDSIVLSLGGRVAEEIVLDDISTGASNDIQQATSIARNMVTRYGMSEKLGTVLYGSEHSQDAVFLGRDFAAGQNYSEKTAAVIDDEIRSIIADAHDRCKKYLTENIEKLHFVAEFLLKYETMDQEQFEAAMSAEAPTFEEIENIANEKKKKSDEENKTAHENNARAEEEARKRREAEAAEQMRRMKAEKDGDSADFFDAFWSEQQKYHNGGEAENSPTPDVDGMAEGVSDNDESDSNNRESADNEAPNADSSDESK